MAIDVNNTIVKHLDGTFEEQLGEKWTARYSEDPNTGLWIIEIFNHNVAEWRSQDFTSIEEAQQAAHDYYDQLIE
jgi:hypothetical protein